MKPEQRRLSGLASDEIARDESDKLTTPEETEVLPEERGKTFKNPGFARLRTEWRGDDRKVIDQVREAVNAKILHLFGDAYAVMGQIYDVVRTPEYDHEGDVVKDAYGMTVWKRTVAGFDEDWTRLTHKHMEHYIFVISTKLFDWRERAADIWGESMVSRGMFEEQFAIGFDRPVSGTEGDRRAAGNLGARDERYFALYQAWLSRRADAVVKSMESLDQRMKDLLTAK